MKTESEASLTHTQAVLSIANHVIAASGMCGSTILEECNAIEERVQSGEIDASKYEMMVSAAVSSVIGLLSNMLIFYARMLMDPPEHADGSAVNAARGVVATIGMSLLSMEERYGKGFDTDKARQLAQQLIHLSDEAMTILQAWLDTPEQPQDRDKVYLN